MTGDSSVTYTINASANEFGIILPSGNNIVRPGETITFTLQAKTGTSVNNLMFDGEYVPLAVQFTDSLRGTPPQWS